MERIKKYKNKLISLIFIGFLIAINSVAYTQVKILKSDITGYIKDAKSGEALPYANVMVQGTNRGTTTNTDGYFVLAKEPLGTLKILVRYIGYNSKSNDVENKVDGLSPLSIETNMLQVEDVTVTATATRVRLNILI